MGARDELESRGGHTFTYRTATLCNVHPSQQPSRISFKCFQQQPMIALAVALPPNIKHPIPYPLQRLPLQPGGHRLSLNAAAA
eukprot:1912186-Rhodomonas_salina.1